jgi:GTP-binding protein
MRTNLLIHLVDASAIDPEDPMADLNTVNRELGLFDPELAEKLQIVVANKIDLPEGRERAKRLARKLPKKFGPLHSISAATTEGVQKLVQTVGNRLEEIKASGEDYRDSAGA